MRGEYRRTTHCITKRFFAKCEELRRVNEGKELFAETLNMRRCTRTCTHVGFLRIVAAHKAKYSTGLGGKDVAKKAN